MGILRVPRNPIGVLLVVFLWWPIAIPLWLVWFIFIGWWWRLSTEPYANIDVIVSGKRRRR